MSDGVFNALDDEKILGCMKQDVYASAQCLEQSILAHNDSEQDNYTAILIECPKIDRLMVTEMRKNKLRILWAITALALLALAPVSSLAETNKAVLDACNSVVRVYTYSSSADEGYIGTGFAVGPKDRPVELIVTNCHVITDVNGNICDEVYVVLEDLDHLESVLVAEPVAYDATIDYAILSIEPTTARKPLALMSATKIERSETVYALGFPGVSDSINDAGYILPSTIDDITITRGIVSKTNAQSEGVSYIQSDCTINGGNSGGPLLTEDGVCIGINTFSATQGVSTFGSIYIDYVTDVLDEAGVPYIEGGAEASPAPSDPGEAAFWGIGEPQPMTNPRRPEHGRDHSDWRRGGAAYHQFDLYGQAREEFGGARGLRQEAESSQTGRGGSPLRNVRGIQGQEGIVQLCDPVRFRPVCGERLFNRGQHSARKGRFDLQHRLSGRNSGNQHAALQAAGCGRRAGRHGS